MQPELATSPGQGMIGAARDLAHRLHIPTTLLKFLIVGGIGFLINQFFLFVFYDSQVGDVLLPAQHTEVDFGAFVHPDIRLLFASIMAVEIAIFCQFIMNDRWTFRDRRRGGNIFVRYVQYNLTSIVSPIITVVTINVLTPLIRGAAGDDSLAGELAPYLANTLGVLMGFTWNWTINSMIIWPRASEGATAAGQADAAPARGGASAWAQGIFRKHGVLIRYVVIGGLGYAIYSALLFVMYDVSAIPLLPDKGTSVDLGVFTHDDALLLITTLLATQISIVAVFAGHNAWTFAGYAVQTKPLWVRFIQFEARALISTLAVLTVVVNAAVVVAGLHPFVAVPLGMVISFAWNWGWDSQFIWKRGSRRE